MGILFIGASFASLRYSPAHSHASWEIVLNLTGTGTARIGKEDYEFYPGSILCIPPNTDHSKDSKTGFTDIYISCSQFPLKGETMDVPLLFEDDSAGSFRSILNTMFNLYHKKEGNYLSIVNSLYEGAIQFLIGKRKNRAAEESVEKIKDILVSSFSDPEINIDEILNNSRYSRDHTRRLFKAVEGITPGEYLTNVRISYAKKLLEQNDLLHLSIGDIGFMCGYYDIHYFSRIFRAKTGVAPRDYLKTRSTP
ncbi:MAG: AraC family transcriptional regulator [Oscillospiraceae bacterium]